MGQTFLTIIRPVQGLRTLLRSDPCKSFDVPREAKRMVTFLHHRGPKLRLPVEMLGSRILVQRRGQVFSVYVPHPKGLVFMTHIEKTLGKEVTTRTWETVAKVVRKAL